MAFFFIHLMLELKNALIHLNKHRLIEWDDNRLRSPRYSVVLPPFHPIALKWFASNRGIEKSVQTLGFQFH